MNRVFLQLWEETSKTQGVLTDGCSLHLSKSDRDHYISNFYSNRKVGDDIPNSYERILGDEVTVFASDELFEKILFEKSIKISEVELRNLIHLEELIINQSIL